MIKVVKETWNCDKGFSKKIYKLEEDKDMQLIKDGIVYATQTSKFQVVKNDWNCDNDIYELFGAYFDVDGYNDFLTPENIVNMIIEEDYEIIYKNNNL